MNELEASEILFAQKLSSGEPATRRLAFKKLSTWLRTHCRQSSTEQKQSTLNRDDMLRIWKGLYMAVWMQDKAILQEELADSIGALIDVIECDRQAALFVEIMLITLSREWITIDRWRLDKFLMLMRRCLRALFMRLRRSKWQPQIIEVIFDAFRRTVLTDDETCVDGVKFHFLSIYLDELDNAGGLSRTQVIDMLQPMINLLTNQRISNYLFGSIIEEIFVAILHQHSEQLAATNDDNNEQLDNDDNNSLQFDYEKIADLLFDIAKEQQMKSSRRKRIYSIVKMFKMAANGEDALSCIIPAPNSDDDITEKEIESASHKLLRREKQTAIDRKKSKKRKKTATSIDDLVLNKRKMLKSLMKPKKKTTIKKQKTTINKKKRMTDR